MYENSSKKIYYTIGEVAKLLNLTTSLIRYWEKEFDIIKPVKNKKGNRFFTETDIENIKFIRYLLKEKGYTIEGAKKKIKEEKKSKNTNPEIINKLQSIRKKLIEIKNFVELVENSNK